MEPMDPADIELSRESHLVVADLFEEAGDVWEAQVMRGPFGHAMHTSLCDSPDRELKDIFNEVVKAISRLVYNDRRGRRTHPEGKVDDVGRWHPTDREDLDGQFVKMSSPSRADARKRGHCVKLVTAWMTGGTVPPDVAKHGREYLLVTFGGYVKCRKCKKPTAREDLNWYTADGSRKLKNPACKTCHEDAVRGLTNREESRFDHTSYAPRDEDNPYYD